MAWKIILFELSRKEKPVEQFIKSCQSSTIAKIIHHIDLLEHYGSLLGMPHSKKLTKELYELRIRGKQEIRIIYTFMGKSVYLLHVFKKQTQKTPKKHIETALNRLNSLT